eukprot:2104521-Heterocapsa_arctica.AAC.1
MVITIFVGDQSARRCQLRRRAARSYKNLAIVVKLEPVGPGLPATENCEPPQCGWALLNAL